MTVKLHHGDCIEVLSTLEEESADTAITDPPYGLKFMGKDWDHGVPGVPFWESILRVAKPGAMLLAFGGTRTHHRLMCTIEDAGWVIRDCLMWLYGSGFPKSHDISKAIDKAAGAEREVIATIKKKPSASSDCNEGWVRPWAEGKTTMDITALATPAAQLWDGYGTALKPAWEPIILAMKPLDGTFAHNALEHGVAGLWVDGGRVPPSEGDDLGRSPLKADGTRSQKVGHDGWDRPWKHEQQRKEEYAPLGRWPANLILDEQAAVMLDAQSSGASRFFYCAKASRSERTCNGKVENKHPTVKPLALMRHLVRLTKTPTGGIVLDPFMGSGSTGCASVLEGRSFIGIDKDADSFEIAGHRIAYVQNEMEQLTLEEIQ